MWPLPTPGCVASPPSWGMGRLSQPQPRPNRLSPHEAARRCGRRWTRCWLWFLPVHAIYGHTAPSSAPGGDSGAPGDLSCSTATIASLCRPIISGWKGSSEACAGISVALVVSPPPARCATSDSSRSCLPLRVRRSCSTHLRTVPHAQYVARRRLAEGESGRQLLGRLRRDTAGTIAALLQRRATRRAVLAATAPLPALINTG